MVVVLGREKKHFNVPLFGEGEKGFAYIFSLDQVPKKV